MENIYTEMRDAAYGKTVDLEKSVETSSNEKIRSSERFICRKPLKHLPTPRRKFENPFLHNSFRTEKEGQRTTECKSLELQIGPLYMRL